MLTARGKGPVAECRFRPPTGGPIVTTKVWIRRLYQQGFCCVESVHPNFSFGREGVWVVKNGILWQSYLPIILHGYILQQPLPFQFRPVKRIPEEIIEKGEALSSEHLQAFFTRLRQAGFLSSLPKLNAKTCPKELNWKNMRPDYQGF